jgi:hypothetical protein
MSKTDQRALIAGLRERLDALVPDERHSGQWQLGFCQGRDAAAKLLLDLAEKGLEAEGTVRNFLRGRTDRAGAAHPLGALFVYVEGLEFAESERKSQLAAVEAERDRLKKIVDDLPMCDQCGGRFPYAKLSPASPHPEAAAICESCVENLTIRAERDEITNRSIAMHSENVTLRAERDRLRKDWCQKCGRKFATVNDFRAIAYDHRAADGLCPTRYAFRDPDAQRDCDAAAEASKLAQEMASG